MPGLVTLFVVGFVVTQVCFSTVGQVALGPVQKFLGRIDGGLGGLWPQGFLGPVGAYLLLPLLLCFLRGPPGPGRGAQPPGPPFPTPGRRGLDHPPWQPRIRAGPPPLSGFIVFAAPPGSCSGRRAAVGVPGATSGL